MREPDRARRLYQNLISLYPKEFRDRVGPSMDQTFADRVRDRRGGGGRLVLFLAWTYAETVLGIVKEHTRRPRTVRFVAAVAGLVAVVPLMVLEWVTSSDRPRSDFALPLFGVLWLLVFLFVRGLVGVLRSVHGMRTGPAAVLTSMSLLARIAFLGLIAWTWISGVIDQWPCFLGASGC